MKLSELDLRVRRDRREARQQWANELICDANVATVTVEHAAWALGISRVTAYKSIKENGWLMEGIPVIRIGQTIRIPTAHIRQTLGLEVTQ
jgi:hypothetical protein